MRLRAQSARDSTQPAPLRPAVPARSPVGRTRAPRPQSGRSPSTSPPADRALASGEGSAADPAGAQAEPGRRGCCWLIAQDCGPRHGEQGWAEQAGRGKGRAGWIGVRRWRVGAADAARGRGLFVLRRGIGTKEVAGGGGCLAGHLPLSVTHGSMSCADPPGCPEHSLRIDGVPGSAPAWSRWDRGERGPSENLALVSLVGRLRLSRSVWSQVGSAVIARRGLEWVSGTPPPRKKNWGQADLICLQLSFPPQLSPPEQAPTSLAPRLAPSIEWERRGVAWHRACTPPALSTRELLGRLSLVSSPLDPGHLDYLLRRGQTQTHCAQLSGERRQVRHMTF